MATRTLTTSYLLRLSVANHDGVTQQIDDRLQAFGTDNQMLKEAAAAVHQARQKEDEAYRRYSGKDFASDDLKKADQLEDNYMSVIRNVLNGLLYLPETEPMRRKAQLAVQLFKDFQFSTNDGIEAEARKTVNMVQQWTSATDYSLAELGIQEWVTKANQQAKAVLSLVAQRVTNESEKVKGEMAAARKATDAAIRKAYDVLNALMVLAPSDALTQTVNLLLSIEDRAKLYYISGGKSSGEKPTTSGDGGSTESGSSDGGSTEGGSTDSGPSDGSSSDGGSNTPSPTPSGNDDKSSSDDGFGGDE